MGYIWLIYFSSMALAFWFAMTLMYDGDEVTKKPSRNSPIKNADFSWEICWTSGLKKKNLDQMDIRVNRSINQKALCLSNLLNTVETKMSTCASSLYLQFDRIWLPAKSCQPFSAAWHGWAFRSIFSSVLEGAFLLFLISFKASNITVKCPLQTLVDGFHYQIIFSRILCNAEVKLQVCWLWVSWLVTLALDLLALLQRRHMFMSQGWLSAIQLC